MIFFIYFLHQKLKHKNNSSLEHHVPFAWGMQTVLLNYWSLHCEWPRNRFVAPCSWTPWLHACSRLVSLTWTPWLCSCNEGFVSLRWTPWHNDRLVSFIRNPWLWGVKDGLVSLVWIPWFRGRNNGLVRAMWTPWLQ
jgi:hypothetical protein